MKKLVTLAVLIAMLAIQLTSCAPAPTAAPVVTEAPVVVVPTDVPPTPEPTVDVEAAKIAGALAEGEIVSYGMTDDWVNLGEIWRTIESRYGVVHSDTDMTSAELITRGLAEKDAPVQDVADIGFDFVKPLIDNNLAQPYFNTSWDLVPDNFKDADGRWTAAYWGAWSIPTWSPILL
jgi:hypothetical protein